MSKISRESIPPASTYFDPILSRTGVAEYTPSDPFNPDPLLRFDWYDPLDYTINKMMSRMTVLDRITYEGEPITTLSYRFYGTTTAWWIIVQYNGYLHPDEIPNGQSLDMPDINQMISFLLERESEKGREVTF